LGAGCATGPEPESLPPQYLTLVDAQDIAAYFYGQQMSKLGDHPLRHAKTFEDALEILRTDNVALFPTGIRVAMQLPGVKGLAMVAQIELAWGEGLILLGRVQLKMVEQLEPYRERLREKKSLGTLNINEKQDLDILEDALDETRVLAEALGLVGAHRMSIGGQTARQVIERYPSSYLGYRVAADFYRMTGNWRKFDEVMAKLTEINPVSVGLYFQRGASLLDRGGDHTEARRWLKLALSRDKKFTRAWVHLLMAQDSNMDFEREFRRFRTERPDHQLVLWAAPLIGRLHHIRLTYPRL
jgi:tetratricopeptide (TPR) repeat protein